ncbi:MAG: hypothetical protein AABW51_04020 [Nanoarchaeota archaeon]
MSKKLSFDEMVGLANKVGYWGVNLRYTEEVIDSFRGDYTGSVDSISIKLTSNPLSISAHYKGIILGKEVDRDEVLKRLHVKIYRKWKSTTSHDLVPVRNKGRNLVRKLLKS